MSECDLAANLSKARENISIAISRGPHSAEKVRLIAVSKTVSIEKIISAVSAGQTEFGENYVQEAKAKIDVIVRQLEARPTFHFIGHLQRNKAKDAVALFDLIHTVDRLELAVEIDRQAAKIGKVQHVLIQANISGEASKSGTRTDWLRTLLESASKMPNLKLTGLMCIGSYIEPSESDSLRRAEFIRMRELRNELQESTGVLLPDLSMGMSHDYQLAIEEGATYVRIGSAIFGKRENV